MNRQQSYQSEDASGRGRWCWPAPAAIFVLVELKRSVWGGKPWIRLPLVRGADHGLVHVGVELDGHGGAVQPGTRVAVETADLAEELAEAARRVVDVVERVAHLDGRGSVLLVERGVHAELPRDLVVRLIGDLLVQRHAEGSGHPVRLVAEVLLHEGELLLGPLFDGVLDHRVRHRALLTVS